MLCVGGFAHQLISVTINTLSADVFPSRQLGTANGWVGAAGWTGGLLFSLFIGQAVQATGYGPLFACLSVFDLLGALALVLLLRGVDPSRRPLEMRRATLDRPPVFHLPRRTAPG